MKASSLRANAFESAALALYALALAYLVSNHSLSNDEVQAWLIARDSADIWDLFKNLRYEGHPPLWHLILMPLTRLSRDPEWMQWLHAAFAIGLVALVLWTSPLTRLEKALFPFGYFVLLQYGVVSRSYVVGFLLLVLLCVVWPARRDRPLLLALLLALLANVHILFAIVAIAFVLGLVAERVMTRELGRPVDLAAAAIFLAALGVAVFTAMPEPDSGYATEWVFSFAPQRIGSVGRGVAAAIGSRHYVMAIPAMLVFGYVLWRLRSNIGAAVFVSAAIAGLMAFQYVKYPGTVWHHGIYFAVLCAAIWLERAGSAQPSRTAVVVGSTVLFAQISMAGLAAWQSAGKPHSHSQSAAHYLRIAGWHREPLIAVRGHYMQPLIGYLDIEGFYSLSAARWMSFIIWDQAWARPIDVREGLRSGLAVTGTPATLIVEPDGEGRPEDFEAEGFREVARFDKPRAQIGNYVIYRHDGAGRAPISEKPLASP